MSYTPQTWHDSPTVDTPITAARLGHMEDGIDAAYDFDPTGTDLVSTTVQDALEELDANRDTDIATAVSQARSGVLLSTDQPLLVGRGNWADNSEQTMDRDHCSGSMTLTTSTLFFSYFTAQQARAGVTAIKVCTFTTAISPTPSLAKMGLYSVDATTGDLTLLAGSANTTTLFAATSTLYTVSIASTALVKGSRYAVGIVQVGGTTAPKIVGVVTNAAFTFDPPAIAASVAATDLTSSVTAASLSSTSGRVWARVS